MSEKPSPYSSAGPHRVALGERAATGGTLQIEPTPGVTELKLDGPGIGDGIYPTPDAGKLQVHAPGVVTPSPVVVNDASGTWTITQWSRTRLGVEPQWTLTIDGFHKWPRWRVWLLRVLFGGRVER